MNFILYIRGKSKFITSRTACYKFVITVNRNFLFNFLIKKMASVFFTIIIISLYNATVWCITMRQTLIKITW